MTYSLWSSDFASYLEDYLIEKHCTWDKGSLWHKDWPCKIYVDQWPIFHGPLILPYIIVRQNQQNDCAPSEDSDQPGHPSSLIRVFAVRLQKAWVFSYPLSAQRRLWSDWADAQADLSLRWAHSHFVGFVTRRLITIVVMMMMIDVSLGPLFTWPVLRDMLLLYKSSLSGMPKLTSEMATLKPP